MGALALAIAMAILAVWPASCTAQDAPSERPSALFPRLYPNPSGLNGMEELIYAGDLLATSSLFGALVADPSPTLSEKRRALADPPVARALELMRAGLAKPIEPPRLDAEMLILPYAHLRNLGRLVGHEIYVRFADGQTPRAHRALRDGLNLATAAQRGPIIAGLVGTAISAQVVRAYSMHLDQLSASDCGAVLTVVNAWLAVPDRLAEVLRGERRFLVDQASLSMPGTPVHRDAITIIAFLLDTMAEQVRRPPWQRKPLPPIEGEGPAVELARSLAPVEALSRAEEAFQREMGRVQVLGLHAAVRRFRWEHDRLPASLDEVKPGRLGVDPFTGGPVRYRLTGRDTYEITVADPRPAPTPSTAP